MVDPGFPRGECQSVEGGKFFTIGKSDRSVRNKMQFLRIITI